MSVLTINKIVFVNLDSEGNPAPHGKSQIGYIRDQFKDETEVIA